MIDKLEWLINEAVKGRFSCRFYSWQFHYNPLSPAGRRNSFSFFILVNSSISLYHIFSSLVQKSVEIRNLKQMGKRSKKSAVAAAPTATMQSIKDRGPSKKGLVSDTMCLDLGNTSWESIYNLIEVKEPEEISEEDTADSTSKSEASFRDLACSYLYRIAALKNILPYTA